VSGGGGFSYVVPVRWSDGAERDGLTAYLEWLARRCDDVIVVDGSPEPVFAGNAAAWSGRVVHLRPDQAASCLNGKVAGVMTGARRARHRRLLVADDDVRYDPASLRRTLELLDGYDLVQPQNYFDPLPWHARWDTARTLLNRSLGRDYPGTLAVARPFLLALGGYDGDVLFENLELIRTVRAAGGRVAAPLDLYVARVPPSASHFWGQRVRQAYDDFALPGRMAAWLAVLPLLAIALLRRRPGPVAICAALAAAAAEAGRRRARGKAFFPATASLLAPVWVLERGVCAWLAVGQRLRLGGVRYAGAVIPKAANSEAELRRRARARPS